MKSLSHLPSALAAFAFLSTFSTVSAHITYGGRDFGSLITGAAPTVISTATVSASYGWADGTDADFGDSHRTRFFRFTLTAPTGVTISVQRNLLGNGATGTFLPALSLYAGLGAASNALLSPQEQASHDFSTLSVSARPVGTEGSFRALNDWTVGNDPTYNIAGDPTSGILYAARLASFTYIGNAADGTSANYGTAAGIFGDGVADGFVTGTFLNLAAGDYSIDVGGANYADQLLDYGVTPVYPTYGVTVSVQAIPEPSTYALLMGLSALGYLVMQSRRR
jgi:hypothetical protein